MKQFRNLMECINYFSDEKVAWDYFEGLRWDGKPVCPFCGTEKVYRLQKDYREFKCGNKKECDKKFTALKGSILESTKLPLSKWFAAIWLCTAHKKGVSSHQLAKDLGVTQKTGWFLWSRVREMMQNGMGIKLRNVVMVDEMYVKGKRGNKSIKIRKEIAAGIREDKEMVILGLHEFDGNVVYKHITNAEAKTIKEAITNTVEDKTTIIVTDSHKSYPSATKDYILHEVVNHSQGEYVNNAGFTTNGIESCFALFQRGIYGIYHHISEKHMQRYCHEFAYRFNNRKVKDGQRFSLTLTNQHLNGRLKYRVLIGKNQ
jgi:transposase-like protein